MACWWGASSKRKPCQEDWDQEIVHPILTRILEGIGIIETFEIPSSIEISFNLNNI
jgi:hypothetical protein